MSAPQPKPDVPLPVIMLALVICTVIAVLVVKFSGRSQRSSTLGERRVPGFERLYAEAASAAEGDTSARGGDAGPPVTIEFHTYSGFLIVVRQERHCLAVPAGVALELISRLHRYNLVRCLVPYRGSLFVPFLSWQEARTQRKKVQAAILNRV